MKRKNASTRLQKYCNQDFAPLVNGKFGNANRKYGRKNSFLRFLDLSVYATNHQTTVRYQNRNKTNELVTNQQSEPFARSFVVWARSRFPDCSFSQKQSHCRPDTQSENDFPFKCFEKSSYEREHTLFVLQVLLAACI